MIMGLLTGLQNEAADVERRAKNQGIQNGRRVAHYNAEAGALKDQVAPNQKILEDFNTIVAQYNAAGEQHNNEVAKFNNGWWKDEYGPITTRIAAGTPYRAVDFTSTAYMGPSEGTYAPPEYPNRVIVHTDPERGDYTQYNQYAKPGAAPVAPDATAANAANAFLTSQKGTVDALNAKGERVTRMNEQTQNRAETEAERYVSAIELQKRAIDEARNPQQSSSVFDQNMAGIHQTIADWLK